MKKIYTFLIVALISGTAIAQTDIADARTYASGATVTVTGICLHGEGEINDPIIYIQDASAGIALYDWDIVNNLVVARGDEITVTGEISIYNGLIEVANVTSYTINSSGNALPAEQIITPSMQSDDYESELIRVENAIFSAGGGTFTGGTNYSYTASGETGEIRINSGSPLVGLTVPVATVDIVAIQTEYTPFWQILPRDLNDFIPVSSIYLTTALTLTDLQTSSLSLNWETNLAGTTNMMYGLDDTFGSVVNNGGSTTVHDVTLTGLTAATIYYVQAYTVNGPDTAFSATKVVSTVSNSTGKIVAYFNNAVDNNVSDITDAIHVLDFPDSIIAVIDKAMISLDVCVYNNNNVNIVNAINDAYARGCQVRYISEDGTLNSALSGLDANIPYIDGNAVGLMHNKFVIVDADDVNNSYVLTGATNWTPTQLYDDFNDLIIIQDQSLARAYEKEFEEIWGSNGATPNAGNAKFGADKTDDTPHQFIIGGKNVEMYFSPSDNVTSKIQAAIESADQDLQFSLLSFTRNELGTAVANRFNAGVSVRGIIESISDQGCEYQFLANTVGVQVVSHQGITYQMHHKYGIVDATNASSDPIVVTGSHNWTTAGETKNDENTLIIHDHVIANQYLEEFTTNYANTANNSPLSRPIISLNQTDISCNGNTDGTITSYVTGGQTPYSYLWSTGATTWSLSGLSSGTYTLTVTDVNDSLDSRFVQILEPLILSTSSTITAETCGNGQGMVELTVSGGTGDYTYMWNSGGSIEVADQLVAGTYGVTITDENGCSLVEAFAVGGGSATVLAVTSTDATACGVSDGTVLASVTGGVTPYNYMWSSGQTTLNLSGLGFGAYVLTVTDFSGCTAWQSILINESGAPSITVTAVDAPCNGLAGGSAQVSSNTSYTYLWSDGQSTSNATSLMAGNYVVTVFDGACNMVGAATVAEASLIVVAYSQTNVFCNGGNDGAITANPSGGNSPYTYVWETLDITETITGLMAVTYCVTVSDNNSCDVVQCVSVTEPTDITITAAVTNLTCNGTLNGSVSYTTLGGTTPYSYTWASGPGNSAMANLAGGTYNVTVQDFNNCISYGNATVTEPAAIALTITANDISCVGLVDGSLTASVIGGSTPFSYNWDNANFTQTISGLSSGIYYITVSDANNCSINTLAQITEPVAATVSTLYITNESTTGANDGAIAVQSSGGTGTFTYIWSNTMTNDTIAGLAAGNYMVTATDANGCEAMLTVTVGTGSSITEMGQGNGINIYPNPMLTGSNLIFSADSPIENITIYNELGQSVYRKTVINTETISISLNSDLSSGIYMINVSINGKLMTRRLVIN